jgi:HYR domain
VKPHHVVAPLALAFALVSLAGPAPSARADGCRHADVVFYTTDSLRLGQRLAVNPSPCADYFISVTPMTDGLTPRAIAATIRSNGPQFHAMAEVRPDTWATWVTTNGKTWFDAGVEARARMATAGYDVSSGDTWAINELKANVLTNAGTSRADFREFLRGLYTGNGTPSQGLVFVADPLQVTTDLSQYHQQLQDFFDDAPFWDDMSHYVRFWGQEVYADARLWGVAGADLGTRRDHLNDYLQHALLLAEAGPGSAAAARSFLEQAYTPVANAAWPQVPNESAGTGFGYTNVTAPVMEAFIASQTDALRGFSAAHAPGGADRFGFAWVPKAVSGVPPAATFIEMLDDLAASVHNSDTDPAGACSGTVCDGIVDGASLSEAWKIFQAWSPPTNTPAGLGVQVQAGPGVTVTFSSVDSSGSTQATASATGFPPPAGFRLQAGALYEDIETTAGYTGPVDVCVSYSGADYTGLAPHLFHYADGAWNDATTTVDPASQTVCGSVTSLSPFVVFAGDTTPPVIEPELDGPLGTNGWYTGDVTVRWNVIDQQSPILSSSGCDQTVVAADTAGTTLTCTATSDGGTATASVTVKRDSAAPLLTVPSDVTVDATGPAGTAVPFDATATDALDPAPAVSCVPASGAVLAIGTTTVACTATDAAGNQTSASFAVTVRGAADQLRRLVSDTAAAVGVPWLVRLVLVVDLDLALARSGAASPAGCSALTAYSTLAASHLVPSQTAAPLLVDAARIRSVLGC